MTKMINNKKTKNKYIILIAMILLVAIVIGAYIYISGSSGRELKKQLDLGHKYLTEQNYEQAITSFKLAIEIDPMNAEAYLGMADAYIGMDDLESAKTMLEDAIELFEENGLDATALKDKLAEVQAELDRIEQERIEAEKKKAEEEERLFFERMTNLSYELYDCVSSPESSYVLDAYTWEQRSELCHPIIEKALECIDYCEEKDMDEICLKAEGKGVNGVIISVEQLYDYCERLYRRCDEMDECYAIRKRHAERIGVLEMANDGYVDIWGESYTDVYDKYGRLIETSNGEGYRVVTTYYAGDLVALEESYYTTGNYSKMSREYDGEGREISESHGTNDETYDMWSYEYIGDSVLVNYRNLVTERHFGSAYPEETYYIDDYGYAHSPDTE